MATLLVCDLCEAHLSKKDKLFELIIKNSERPVLVRSEICDACYLIYADVQKKIDGNIKVDEKNGYQPKKTPLNSKQRVQPSKSSSGIIYAPLIMKGDENKETFGVQTDPKNVFDAMNKAKKNHKIACQHESVTFDGKPICKKCGDEVVVKE